MRLEVHRVPLADERPLLQLLPDLPDVERFAFVHGDGGDGNHGGAVGWGVAARIPVGTGPDRFARAREALDGLAGDPGLVAFASFTFDEDEDASVMVVPRTVVVRRDGATWRIDAGQQGDAIEVAATVAAARPAPSTHDRPRYGGSTVRDDVWLDAVARAIADIEDGAYAKVVLARDLHLWSRTDFDERWLLGALAARFSSCMTFLVDHLIGASPELLLRREHHQVASRVLAGTAPRGADAATDDEFGAALLASEKDRHEHDLALRSAVDALAPVCSSLDVVDAPSLVRLDNVQHLGTELTGTLDATRDTHVLSLLGRLHPTAAVGGAPRAAALSAIRRLEGMSRGRYSGPVGWCMPDGDGEFAIALRCAEVHGPRARLFAGAGIVAGSLPESELTETWLKLQAMTSVLDA